ARVLLQGKRFDKVSKRMTVFWIKLQSLVYVINRSIGLSRFPLQKRLGQRNVIVRLVGLVLDRPGEPHLRLGILLRFKVILPQKRERTRVLGRIFELVRARGISPLQILDSLLCSRDLIERSRGAYLCFEVARVRPRLLEDLLDLGHHLLLALA